MTCWACTIPQSSRPHTKEQICASLSGDIVQTQHRTRGRGTKREKRSAAHPEIVLWEALHFAFIFYVSINLHRLEAVLRRHRCRVSQFGVSTDLPRRPPFEELKGGKRSDHEHHQRRE